MDVVLMSNARKLELGARIDYIYLGDLVLISSGIWKERSRRNLRLQSLLLVKSGDISFVMKA
jgi:hypothetical protein